MSKRTTAALPQSMVALWENTSAHHMNTYPEPRAIQQVEALIMMSHVAKEFQH